MQNDTGQVIHFRVTRQDGVKVDQLYEKYAAKNRGV